MQAGSLTGGQMNQMTSWKKPVEFHWCQGFYAGASLVAQTVKNPPVMPETQVQALGQEDSPGERNGYPLQYSCLENPVNREAWWTIVHGVTESDVTEWLSTHTPKDFMLLFLRGNCPHRMAPFSRQSRAGLHHQRGQSHLPWCSVWGQVQTHHVPDSSLSPNTGLPQGFHPIWTFELTTWWSWPGPARPTSQNSGEEWSEPTRGSHSAQDTAGCQSMSFQEGASFFRLSLVPLSTSKVKHWVSYKESTGNFFQEKASERC